MPWKNKFPLFLSQLNLMNYDLQNQYSEISTFDYHMFCIPQTQSCIILKKNGNDVLIYLTIVDFCLAAFNTSGK